MGNVREKLGQSYEFPNGFKQSIKPDSGSARKYSGTPKFKDLENWLVTVTNCFTLSRLGGPDTAVDKLRIDFLQSWLEGEALEWYNRHVVSATRAITLWMFCDMIEGLYDCFVHASSMQDAREGFQRVQYSATTGVQSFYNTLLDHAHNMSVYPDNYSILEQFLTGLLMPMVNRILEEGYSPEIHTVEEFAVVYPAPTFQVDSRWNGSVPQITTWIPHVTPWIPHITPWIPHITPWIPHTPTMDSMTFYMESITFHMDSTHI